MNRRGFLTACIATCTAPMIVRASSLMPVRAWARDDVLTIEKLRRARDILDAANVPMTATEVLTMEQQWLLAAGQVLQGHVDDLLRPYVGQMLKVMDMPDRQWLRLEKAA